MTPAAHIAELHRAYVNLTGLDVALNMDRERTWFEWLNYRRDDPFTAADLKLVIDFLRRGIREERRNAGSLRFRNLIGSPDDFDEDRAAARKAAAVAAKPRPPAMVNECTTAPDGGTVNKLVPNDGTQDTSKPIRDFIPDYEVWKKKTFGK